MSQALTTLEHEIIELAPQFATMLPPDVSPDKFREVALAAIRRMPGLVSCNRQSLFNALINAAQDGLMPDGREAAIVPRKGMANYQPMVAGIYKKVKTSGSVATISANVVYDGEPFEVLLGDDERIVHRRDMSKVADGNEAAVYAIATLKDGSKEREVMTWDQVMTVRQTSSTPNDGPWVTSPGEMARKTVVRRLAKRLPVLDQADEALQRTIGRVDSLYSFGTPAPEAPQPPSSPRDAINAQIPLKAVAASTTRADRVQDMSTTYDPADDPADDHHDPADVCPKCRGTGEFRPGMKCFACNGTGNTAKKPIVTGKDTTRKPVVTEEPVMTWTQWAESLERADRDSKATVEIGRIISRSEVAEIVRLAQEGEPSPAKTRIVAAFRNLEARYLADPPQPPDADDLDEVVIEGQEKLAAG
jgi:recombination protein RecT